VDLGGVGALNKAVTVSQCYAQLLRFFPAKTGTQCAAGPGRIGHEVVRMRARIF